MAEDALPEEEATDAPDSAERRLARYWIAEINSSEKWLEPWCIRARRIVHLYRKQDLNNANGSQPLATTEGKRQYALLWAIVETLKPAVYARAPNPVVSRRFKDSDPVGRYASEVLERALSYGVDRYGFDALMKQSRNDWLLTARGQMWVRYVPHEAVVPGSADEETQVTNNAPLIESSEPAYAETLCDHVHFSDWGCQPCREWASSSYAWRRTYLGRKGLIARFGSKLGKVIPLDWEPKDNPFGDPEVKARFKQAAIYEIWDKTSGKIVWLSKSYPMSVLDQRDPPFKLQNFFPCPAPLMGTTPPDNFIPVPDYVYYQDQAEELNELTAKIGNLTRALRMIGVYAAEEGTTLANMFNQNQVGNTVIPVRSMAGLNDKGGMKGIIDWMPIDMVIQALTGCYTARREIMQDVWQITGIADIMRGESDPRETLGAQQLKTQWGSARVWDRQAEIQRFIRDTLDIQAQIIAQKYPAQVLAVMTDVKLLTAQQKQTLQTAMQLAQANQQMAPQILQQAAQGMPPAPIGRDPIGYYQELIGLPSWDDVTGLLQNNSLRDFRVDVETDSTIQPDEDADKARAIEFTEAVGGLLAQSETIVEKAPELAQLVGEFIKFVARKFRVGRELEDVIERTMDKVEKRAMQAAANPQPAEQTGKSPQELQIMMGELQLKMQELQAKQQDSAMSAQIKQQEAAMKAQSDALKAQTEAQRTRQDGMADAADFALRNRELDIKEVIASRDPKPQAVA